MVSRHWDGGSDWASSSTTSESGGARRDDGAKQDLLALSWSGGKDSAFALHELRRAGRDVAALVTTVNHEYDRVSIHGVRIRLARAQAATADLPLIEIGLPIPCSNELYESIWVESLAGLKPRLGLDGVAFGDLFLADIREYRERVAARAGLAAEFPLWGRPTPQLARQMLAEGIEARIVSLDPRIIDQRHAGSGWDATFLDALPPSVDPCGERGEFHTLVTNGPMFAEPIDVEAGDVVERDGFVYADFDFATAEMRSLASPCRRICEMGSDGLCDGCGRTIDEIASWLSLPERHREAVMSRVAAWQPR